jgi:molybdopterin synthase sulfur carrier subunit
MEIRVRLFAAFQEVLGTDALPMDWQPGLRAIDVFSWVCEKHPELAPWQPHLRFAVNYEFVPPEHSLAAGDEVALIPPVSGG